MPDVSTVCQFFIFQHKLRHTESERLLIQVNAYLDNMIDVRILLEDSDTKGAAIEKVAELELELSYVSCFYYSEYVRYFVKTVRSWKVIDCLLYL